MYWCTEWSQHGIRSMTNKVPSDTIEGLVGEKRSATLHFAKAVSDEKTVYILHSKRCLIETPDLRNCKYSLALDNGIDMLAWEKCMDQTVWVTIEFEKLFPTSVLQNPI